MAVKKNYVGEFICVSPRWFCFWLTHYARFHLVFLAFWLTDFVATRFYFPIAVEEWNGKREITEKSFEVTFETIPTLVMYCMVVPYGIYTWTRSEFLSRGDRRYKDLV